MNKWISVKTRMPKNHQEDLLLLCLDGKGKQQIHHFLSGAFEDNVFSIDDEFVDDNLDKSMITHWMPVVGPDEAGEAYEVLKDCEELVLCKGELFFQKDGGDTITSWYPVGHEAASVLSLHFDIPLTYEGAGPIDNEKVIKEALVPLGNE